MVQLIRTAVGMSDVFGFVLLVCSLPVIVSCSRENGDTDVKYIKSLEKELNRCRHDHSVTAGVVGESAAALFERFTSSNQIAVVMLKRSVDRNRTLTIYTTGMRSEFAVLAIPTFEHSESGWCIFATLFNINALNLADRLALTGESEKAIRLYRLLDRVDCCGTLPRVRHRMKLAEQIHEGRAVSENAAALSALGTSRSPSILEPDAPQLHVSVSNLLELQVDYFPGVYPFDNRH